MGIGYCAYQTYPTTAYKCDDRADSLQSVRQTDRWNDPPWLTLHPSQTQTVRSGPSPLSGCSEQRAASRSCSVSTTRSGKPSGQRPCPSPLSSNCHVDPTDSTSGCSLTRLMELTLASRVSMWEFH